MRSVALANQKGGVGKTTTAVHLAHGLALVGQRVVLFDLDPQGNATLALQSMSAPARAPRPGSPFAPLQKLMRGLWILPSPGAERNLAADVRPDADKLGSLAKALAGEGIEWLVVDCPPRMDAWGWAGLQLCREVLLPMQAEFFSMHGLSQMMETLRAARRKWAGHGALMGVLATMIDPREAIAMEVVEDLRKNLGSQLFESLVFRDPGFVEAASHGKTVFDYDLDSIGARCYSELVREVLYGRQETR